MFPVPKSDLFICICFQSFFLFPDGCIFVSFWFHLINFWILVCWKYKPMRNKQKKFNELKTKLKYWKRNEEVKSGKRKIAQWPRSASAMASHFAGMAVLFCGNFEFWFQLRRNKRFPTLFSIISQCCASVCVGVCVSVSVCTPVCVSLCLSV